MTLDTENADAVIITYGRLCDEVLSAKAELDAMGIKTGVALLVKIKPIDMQKLKASVGNAKNVVFAEEGVLNGGIAQSVASAFAGRNYRICAVEAPFVAHGTVENQLAASGIDAKSLIKAVTENGECHE